MPIFFFQDWLVSNVRFITIRNLDTYSLSVKLNFSLASSMHSTPYIVKCPIENVEDNVSTSYVYTIKALSIIVSIICLTSFILCCRALIRGQILANEASTFLHDKFKIKISRLEAMQFLNFWYVVICINDLLIIIGTILKEIIENKITNSDLWDFCSSFLGIGNLLVWLGMLRYLGFFQK